MAPVPATTYSPLLRAVSLAQSTALRAPFVVRLCWRPPPPCAARPTSSSRLCPSSIDEDHLRPPRPLLHLLAPVLLPLFGLPYPPIRDAMAAAPWSFIGPYLAGNQTSPVPAAAAVFPSVKRMNTFPGDCQDRSGFAKYRFEYDYR
ncbi:hypothetical protein CFC21_052264 [Triticum aestivum]|uniref:Uncharacterized protein n=3 Tax=Triticum TaxID=4564 RepID=A0A9R0SE12_TRITD|nr:hypothetical protein CFC21_052264 [Triticum aestivum]VAH91234.1 unnamed protein product [Triticum turgidum subsp. durum]